MPTSAPPYTTQGRMHERYTNYLKKVQKETTYPRNHLSLKEKIILDMLNNKYTKYYLIILYYYIYDDNNDIYLDLLKSMKKKPIYKRLS